MKKSKIKKEMTFYFDYVSPYSALAWKKAGRLWEDYDLILKPEPILLGAVLKHWDIKAGPEIPSKREYLIKDVLRSANRDNASVQYPPMHPFNSLLPLRATCLMEGHHEYTVFITHLFALCWQEGADITNPALIEKILKIYGVENGIEKCTDDTIKQMLREKTEKAIERGIFGVPSMIIDDELFWGNDRFDFVENFIRGENPVIKSEFEIYKNIPSWPPKEIPKPEKET